MDEEQLTRPQIVQTCKHEYERRTVNSTSDSANPSMDEEQLTRHQIVYTGKHEYGRGTVNSTSNSTYR